MPLGHPRGTLGAPRACWGVPGVPLGHHRGTPPLPAPPRPQNPALSPPSGHPRSRPKAGLQVGPNGQPNRTIFLLTRFKIHTVFILGSREPECHRIHKHLVHPRILVDPEESLLWTNFKSGPLGPRRSRLMSRSGDAVKTAMKIAVKVRGRPQNTEMRSSLRCCNENCSENCGEKLCEN